MKLRTIKAVLLSVTFFSSVALFSSCDNEKKEEGAANEAPAVEQAEETKEATPIEEVTDTAAVTPEATEDASVETTPVEEATPVEVVKKEAAKVAPEPVEKEIVEEAVAQVVAETKPNLVFDHTSHEFGTINQGDVVTHMFTFTNTGDAPLIINSAKPSCGCTVPSWPKEPIMPGETGEIKAVFNSRHKSGRQNKSIRVFTNMGDQASTVFLKGEVLIPAAEPTPAETPITE